MQNSIDICVGPTDRANTIREVVYSMAYQTVPEWGRSRDRTALLLIKRLMKTTSPSAQQLSKGSLAALVELDRLWG